MSTYYVFSSLSSTKAKTQDLEDTFFFLETNNVLDTFMIQASISIEFFFPYH